MFLADRVSPLAPLVDLVDAGVTVGLGTDNPILNDGVSPLADLAVVDLDYPHPTPCPDPVFTLVHSARGFKIGTVVCDGRVVMADRELESFDEPVDAIVDRAAETATDVVERTGYERRPGR